MVGRVGPESGSIRWELDNVKFPGNRRFALSILDDTDDTTVETGQPVYDLLGDLGFRTTKTVWAFDSPEEEKGPYHMGQTMEDPAYRKWVVSLAEEGFEVAFHNASMASSSRERTEAAIDFLTDDCGFDLRLHCNHGQNRENLFWGPERYHSRALRLAYGLASSTDSEGSETGSPYYWADIAAQRFSYIRDFAFRRLDCSKIGPGRPYRDSTKQPSPCWFNTADAPALPSFLRLVTREAVDRLEDAGGWTIISTHFGKGFAWEGKLNEHFASLMRWIAEKNGWFVPASELLDYIGQTRGATEISRLERTRLEVAHVFDRIRRRREVARYGLWD